MKQLTIHTATHPYTVSIGGGIRFRLQEFLPEEYQTVFIITDTNVGSLYLNDVIDQLTDYRVIHQIIPAKESSKSLDSFSSLQTTAIANGLDRNSLIIALGGGVVGDIAGFIAATYMRGIDYIQMPTTILAHDSSVGGKVAVNHPYGKNLIGSFHPPKAVIYDTATLPSLPVEQIRSGYAEIVKEAFIADENFLQRLLLTTIINSKLENTDAHIHQGITIKKKFIEEDETDTKGSRIFLNFGHTFAHALERETGFETFTHGEAVAIGMLFSLYVSKQYHMDCTGLQESYFSWFVRNEYPLDLDGINPEMLVQHMQNDKKRSGNHIDMVLLRKAGHPVIQPIDFPVLRMYVEQFLREEIR